MSARNHDDVYRAEWAGEGTCGHVHAIGDRIRRVLPSLHVDTFSTGASVGRAGALWLYASFLPCARRDLWRLVSHVHIQHPTDILVMLEKGREQLLCLRSAKQAQSRQPWLHSREGLQVRPARRYPTCAQHAAGHALHAPEKPTDIPPARGELHLTLLTPKRAKRAKEGRARRSRTGASDSPILCARIPLLGVQRRRTGACDGGNG